MERLLPPGTAGCYKHRTVHPSKVSFFAWQGYPGLPIQKGLKRLNACLGEEMASSMHNAETREKFECPILSG